jgi:hypothetical protein
MRTSISFSVPAFAPARRSAGSQRPRLNPAVLVKLAKMRPRLLNDATPDANAPHQTPITVEPSHPSCESYGADTCAIRIMLAAKENTQGRH